MGRTDREENISSIFCTPHTHRCFKSCRNAGMMNMSLNQTTPGLGLVLLYATRVADDTETFLLKGGRMGLARAFGGLASLSPADVEVVPVSDPAQDRILRLRSPPRAPDDGGPTGLLRRCAWPSHRIRGTRLGEPLRRSLCSSVREHCKGAPLLAAAVAPQSSDTKLQC